MQVTTHTWWRSGALWIAAHEYLVVISAAPLLLFPGWWTIAGIGLILSGWTGRWVATGRLSAVTALDVPIALLALSMCIGASVSANPSASNDRAWGMVLGFAVYYTVVNATPAVRSKAAGSLIAAGVIVSVVGVLGTDWTIAPALASGGPVAVYDHLASLLHVLPGDALARALDLANPREVGGSLALVLPLAVARLWQGLSGTSRDPIGLACTIIAIGLMGVVLVLSQSLSAIAGVLVAFWLSVAVADRPRRGWWLAGGTVLLACGLAVIWPRLGGLSLLRDSTAMPGQPAPGVEHAAFAVAARLELWPRALQMLRDTPYTGAGLGAFAWVMDRFYSGFVLGPERHTHNVFLQVGVDLGLPGLVAFVWLLAAFAGHVYVSYCGSPGAATRATSLASAAGVLAFLLFGTIDVVPLGAAPAVMLWIVFGLAMAQRLPVSATQQQPDRRRLSPLDLGMVLLLVIALLAPVAWNGPALNAGRVLAYEVLLAPSRAPHDQWRSRHASAHLAHAVQGHPHQGRTWYLLGMMAAERGEPEEALHALRRGVFADSNAPLRRYALSEAVFSPGIGLDWPALQRVYGQWTTRYPRRVEWYVASAIGACEGEGDQHAALARLAQGLDAGAEPRMLLSAYHRYIVDGRAC